MANGLYNSEELIDTLIQDLNNLPKHLIGNQFILFCATVEMMGQKLYKLKDGIRHDMADREETIADLKDQLRQAGVDIVDMNPKEFIESIKEVPSMQKEDGGKDGTN